LQHGQAVGKGGAVILQGRTGGGQQRQSLKGKAVEQFQGGLQVAFVDRVEGAAEVGNG
jgi:hypothetical protein